MSLTESNRSVIEEFAKIFYAERDPQRAFETFVVPDYIQHNPRFPDGRDETIPGLVAMFTAEGARFDVQRIVVDGDLAAVHLKGQPAGRPPVAVADFYRLVDGKIVGHWDVIQPIPEESANPHPMF